MRYLAYLSLICFFASCTAPKLAEQRYQEPAYYEPDPPITKSLFDDTNATITEENIQKILDGSYTLPANLRISIVQLKSAQNNRSYYWNNETYLKSQQAYLDRFSEQFQRSGRVTRIAPIPDILLAKTPTFTSIREAAVRTQSDLVVIYAINSDLYSRYKLFSKAAIKAFATTQLIVMDVRTGLIPFSTIVTKDYQSTRQEGELNNTEATNRIKNAAVLRTIEEIGQQVNAFLEEE